MKLIRTAKKPKLEVSRSEWERIGIKAGWFAPGIRRHAGGLICSICGKLVGGHDLKRHLVDMHGGNPGMDFDEVRENYFKPCPMPGQERTAQSVGGRVEIRRYGDSAWAIFVDGRPVSVTVYRMDGLSDGDLLTEILGRIEGVGVRVGDGADAAA